MPITRRRFIGDLALLGASASLLPSLARASAAPIAARGPKALIHIFPRGGIDPVLTTNPKIRSQVEASVDVPYEESEISTIGQMRVGPFLRELEKYVPRMAILNNVAGATVAHKEEQAVQMRRLWPSTRIGLAGTVGIMRGADAVFSEVWVTDKVPFNPAGRALVLGRMPPGQSLLTRFAALAHKAPSRQAIEDVLHQELAGCAARGDCVAIEAARALLARLATLELPDVVERPFSSLQVGSPDRAQFASDASKTWSAHIRDIVFLLRNDLTRSIFMWPAFALFDTHQENLEGQRSAMHVFATGVAHLLHQLDNTPGTSGRPLSEDVGIVIASELGRFPRLNDLRGKDHLPEWPAILIGPGIRPGQYGEDDQRMIATPISAATGKPRSSPKDFVPTIDDLGTTILSWFGIEDTAAVGYRGRRLDFLLS